MLVSEELSKERKMAPENTSDHGHIERDRHGLEQQKTAKFVKAQATDSQNSECRRLNTHAPCRADD